tara:strand:- start:22222 stop:23007 length:786 start_codon:yes stop_codon:yes gene_type:complete
MNDKVCLTRQGDVLCIGLNRPDKLNAMDIDLYVQLAEAYGRLDGDPSLRCGVLYGEGAHFTAGLQLDQWAEQFRKGCFPELPAVACDPFGLDPDRRLSKPMVVAVQGICFTAGLELMLAGDIRVASEDCRFGQIEVKRGLYPVGGATVRFIQNMSWGNAMRYLLTGDEFCAREAHRLGLVQEVCEVGQVFERALDIAQRIARQAPRAVLQTLSSARKSLDEGGLEAIDRLIPDLLPLLGSEDFSEGVASFLERRPARFVGR